MQHKKHHATRRVGHKRKETKRDGRQEPPRVQLAQPRGTRALIASIKKKKKRARHSSRTLPSCRTSTLHTRTSESRTQEDREPLTSEPGTRRRWPVSGFDHTDRRRRTANSRNPPRYKSRGRLPWAASVAMRRKTDKKATQRTAPGRRNRSETKTSRPRAALAETVSRSDKSGPDGPSCSRSR